MLYKCIFARMNLISSMLGLEIQNHGRPGREVCWTWKDRIMISFFYHKLHLFRGSRFAADLYLFRMSLFRLLLFLLSVSLDWFPDARGTTYEPLALLNWARLTDEVLDHVVFWITLTQTVMEIRETFYLLRLVLICRNYGFIILIWKVSLIKVWVL